MGGFNPNPDIPLEEIISHYDQKAVAAVQTLIQKGFNMPNRPQYNTSAGPRFYSGELPSDLTNLSDDQLGTYMGLLQEWMQYVGCQLAEADLQLQNAKAKLLGLEAKLRILYQKDGDKKRSNPERDDYLHSDRRFIEMNGEVLYWEGIYGYIRAIARAAENSFAAVSRRITQRGQEIDRHNRTGAATHGGNIPTGPIFGRKS